MIQQTSIKRCKNRNNVWNIGSTTSYGIKPAITKLLSKEKKGRLIGKDVKELCSAR